MLAIQSRNFLLLFLAALCATSVYAQNDSYGTTDSNSEFRWATLPTDRDVRSQLPPLELAPQPDISKLMRPRFRLAAEWEMKTDGIEIGNYDTRVTIPTYPIYGPPPPLISAGFSFTSLTAPDALALPSSLYDFSLGATWMRPLNDQWTMRFVASAAFATDLDNTSSDAWQFRGGAFAVYKWTPKFQLVFGAFATGRDDVPVLPGFGGIWNPNPFWKVDLMMPRPRVSYMVAHTGEREHWLFVGGGLSGGTWAFENANIDDRLTYREWRVGVGWESGPPKLSPFMPADGCTLEAEIGYVFGRSFEFDRRPDEYDIDGTLLLRAGARF